MAASRSYKPRDLALLFGLSGLFCAFPSCTTRLAQQASDKDRAVLLSNICHIEAASDEGPRSNPALTLEQRNAYENLILLCPTHHVLVDKQPNTYTVADLRRWKRDVEARYGAQQGEQVGQVTFLELRAACEGIVSADGLPSTALTAIPPAEKMVANDLTPRVGSLMTMGLAQAPQVARFLEDTATRLDPVFPRRLRAGFVAQYEYLYEDEDLRGDALFIALLQFARQAARPLTVSAAEAFTYEAAALAVLCHLFEVCDVFEAPRAAS